MVVITISRTELECGEVPKRIACFMLKVVAILRLIDLMIEERKRRRKENNEEGDRR